MMPVALEWKSKEAIINSSPNFFRGEVSLVNGTNGFVEYVVKVPAEGKYNLGVHYNAEDSRRLTLRLNQTTVSESIAEGTTGTWWEGSKARMDWYGPFTMKQGRNVVRFESKGFFPHLLDFALKPYEVFNTNSDTHASFNARTHEATPMPLSRALNTAGSPKRIARCHFRGERCGDVARQRRSRQRENTRECKQEAPKHAGHRHDSRLARIRRACC